MGITAKKWYTYKRNGVVYVQFKDRITGKRLTAKSTRERDEEKATEIIQQWYYNPQSGYNTAQKTRENKMIEALIRETGYIGFFQKIVDEMIRQKKVFIPTTATQRYYTATPDAEDESPPEIKELMAALDTISFYDYLLLFWDHAKSPYIKQVKRRAGKVPNPERFKKWYVFFSRRKDAFQGLLLKDISARKINDLIERYQKKTRTTNTQAAALVHVIKQAVRFLFENGLIQKDITKQMIKIAAGEKKKEIFSQEELNRIFNKGGSIFKEKKHRLINTLLMQTGCRVGEVQALTPNDIVKNKNGSYHVVVDKSWSTAGRRVKETKTGRKDTVLISNALAEELLQFIKEMKQSGKDGPFIFSSKTKKTPLRYAIILKNFTQTMQKLGLNRKGLTLHSYRHTYAVMLRDAGYSESDLLLLTRHESTAALKTYISHESESERAKRHEAAKLIQSIFV